MRTILISLALAGCDPATSDGSSAGLADLQARFLFEPTTWTIGSGGDYATLDEALVAVSEVRLGGSASLTLSLLDGTHTMSQGLDLDHLDGERMSLLGSESSAVTLLVPDSGGLVVPTGRRWGTIGHLTLQGVDDQGTGLAVHTGASVTLTDLVFRDFRMGLSVEGGSVEANGGPGLTLTAPSNFRGVSVTSGGLLRADEVVADDNTDTGLWVEGGRVFVATLDVRDCGSYGAVVWSGAMVRAYNVDASGSDVGIGVASSLFTVAGDSVYGDGTTGISVDSGGYAEIGLTTLANLTTGVQVLRHATVDLIGVTFDSSVVTPVENTWGGVAIGYP